MEKNKENKQYMIEEKERLNEEIETHTKLLSSLEEDLDILQKKQIAQIRSIITEENKIENMKKKIEELKEPFKKE